jgi:hypothetical protein
VRTFAIVVVAGLLVVSCGGEERSAAVATDAPPGLTRFVDRRLGFEVTFPSDWQRAGEVLTPSLSEPREILSVGTVRPLANRASTACPQHPVETLAGVGPRDVFVTIQERTSRVAEGMVPGPPRLDAVAADDSELPACLRREVPFKTYWMPFRESGRGFYADAAVGNDVSPEGVAELQALLDSLRFSYPAPWGEPVSDRVFQGE